MYEDEKDLQEVSGSRAGKEGQIPERGSRMGRVWW